MEVRWNQFISIILIVVIAIDYFLIDFFDLVGLWLVILAVMQVWKLNSYEEESTKEVKHE